MDRNVKAKAMLRRSNWRQNPLIPPHALKPQKPTVDDLVVRELAVGTLGLKRIKRVLHVTLEAPFAGGVVRLGVSLAQLDAFLRSALRKLP